jgi:hypothetical protein
LGVVTGTKAAFELAVRDAATRPNTVFVLEEARMVFGMEKGVGTDQLA